MTNLLKIIEDQFKADKATDVRTGDTVKVYQKILEGSKERVQVFEGLVIARKRSGSSTFTITVRRIASGVGVEKTFLVHSPNIQKIEVVKRSKVRRANLNYMRRRSGKAARLTNLMFDENAVNYVPTVEDKAPVPAELIAEASEEAEEPTPAEAEPTAATAPEIVETAEAKDDTPKTVEPAEDKPQQD